MTTNAVAPSKEESAHPPQTTWIRRVLPWILLTLWSLWLLALVVMSIPYWGKSKRELIEPTEPQPRRVEIRNARGK